MRSNPQEAERFYGSPCGHDQRKNVTDPRIKHCRVSGTCTEQLAKISYVHVARRGFCDERCEQVTGRPHSASPFLPGPVRIQAHAEAIAPISFCVEESALGVVTGERWPGQDGRPVCRRLRSGPTRHQVIYIATPAFSTRARMSPSSGRRAPGTQPCYLEAELMA